MHNLQNIVPWRKNKTDFWVTFFRHVNNKIEPKLLHSRYTCSLILTFFTLFPLLYTKYLFFYKVNVNFIHIKSITAKYNNILWYDIYTHLLLLLFLVLFFEVYHFFLNFTLNAHFCSLITYRQVILKCRNRKILKLRFNFRSILNYLFQSQILHFSIVFS